MRLLRIELATFPILWLTGLESAAQSTVGPAWKMESNQFQAAFGYPVSGAGDVNGDGFGDVIIGASGFDGGQENEGRVFVFHGSKDGLGQTPAWTAESDQGFAGVVAAAGAGDVNGDGYDDVIVGFGYSNGEFGEGAARLYLGSAAGLGANPVWAAEALAR